MRHFVPHFLCAAFQSPLHGLESPPGAIRHEADSRIVYLQRLESVPLNFCRFRRFNSSVSSPLVVSLRSSWSTAAVAV